MTLLSWWALAGLALIAPLVLAHLRRRRPPVREVASLLVWQELEGLDAGGERRLRLPRLPLLLALQALALALLVVALARPAGAAPRAVGAARVLVLDDSVWMSVPGRLLAGERELEHAAAGASHGAQIAVVIAGGTSYVLYRGGAAGVPRALGAVHPTTAPEQLESALALAAAQLAPGGRVALARAPEDGLPPLRTGTGELSDALAGPSTGEQAILSPVGRCGVGATGGCEVLATVRNSAPAAVTDTYEVRTSGGAPSTAAVRVPGDGQAQIAVAAGTGTRVSIALLGGNALAGASVASVTVPGPDGVPSPTRVTLVGEPADALVLARALAAVSGVKLRLRTPSDYRAGEARESDVVVLDGSVPGGRLPQAPGVLFVDPRSLPGGHAGAAMSESEVSGSDASSPVLEGVDLSSLEVDSGGAHTITPPAALRWILWSPEGPLLACGLEGTRRVAVMSFDPARSDLPQLQAFPLLIANLLRELTGSSPAPAPSPAASTIDLQAATQTVPGGARVNLAPWLLCAALLVILFEALYGSRRRLTGAL